MGLSDTRGQRVLLGWAWPEFYIGFFGNYNTDEAWVWKTKGGNTVNKRPGSLAMDGEIGTMMDL